jgi:hypothetical protein
MYLLFLLILVDLFIVTVLNKISLKVSKGKSEVVNRMTDNTIAKKKQRQMDKQWSTKHYTEIEHNEPYKKRSELCFNSCIDGTIFIISLISF